MDRVFVKCRQRKVRRRRIGIRRLISMMSSIESDDNKKKKKSTVGIYDEEVVEEEERLQQCVSHGSISVCGRRREMEDAVSVIPGFLSEMDFFGVYDGHGGSRVAQECSEKLHRLLDEEMMMMIDQRSDGGGDEEEDWEKILVSCFLKMDEEVSSGSRGGGGGGHEVDDMKSIGSTAVVALIEKEKIIVANCGDSRAVMSRGGVVVPLSSDHKELEAIAYLLREIYSVNASRMKPDRSDEWKRVEAAGGRVINWDGYRVLGVLATSRSIGDYYLKPYVISVPEVLVTERTKNDEFLILASDGLWDVLSNEQACDVARRCLDGRIMRRMITKSNAANRLVEGAMKAASKSSAASRFVDDGAMRAAAVLTELAMARGSIDNISVVVIELNKMTWKNEEKCTLR